MISFDFKVNKSFLQNSSHPITIPKSLVDYKTIKSMDVVSFDAIIICPDSTKLKGKIYQGTAGYGPYYQIRMEGYAQDPLYKIEKNKNLLIQIQESKTNVLIFLTLDSTQKSTAVYTSKKNEIDQALTEGAVSRIEVNKFERDTKAREICIQHYGAICSVCDFEFKDKYGQMGAGYIHVHHIIPISSIRESYLVDPIEDLRPICPNCHAMVHRKYPPILIDDLKNILKSDR